MALPGLGHEFGIPAGGGNCSGGAGGISLRDLDQPNERTGGTSVTVYGSGLSTADYVYFGTSPVAVDQSTYDAVYGTVTVTSPSGAGSVYMNVYSDVDGATDYSDSNPGPQFTYVSGGGGGGGGGGSTYALAIATTSLPAGTVGQSYGETIATNGEDTAPYTFSVSAGTLPDGLTLDGGSGALSGTPGTAGSYNFTVTVKDATGNSAIESYGLTINPAATNSGGAQTPQLIDIAGNWAEAAIEKLVAMGAITWYPPPTSGGYPTFRPGDNITRAEFATVLVRALKLLPSPGRSLPTRRSTGQSSTSKPRRPTAASQAMTRPTSVRTT